MAENKNVTQSNEEAKKRANARSNYAKKYGTYNEETKSYQITKNADGTLKQKKNLSAQQAILAPIKRDVYEMDRMSHPEFAEYGSDEHFENIKKERELSKRTDPKLADFGTREYFAELAGGETEDTKNRADEWAFSYTQKLLENGTVDYKNLTSGDKKVISRGIEISKILESKFSLIDKRIKGLNYKSLTVEDLALKIQNVLKTTKSRSYIDKIVAGYEYEKLNELLEKKKFDTYGKKAILGSYKRDVYEMDASTRPEMPAFGSDAHFESIKNEYEKNPSLPKFGSREHYIEIAETMVPSIKKITEDVVWRDGTQARQLAEEYLKNPNFTADADTLKSAKFFASKLSMYRNELKRYADVLRAVSAYGNSGVHFKADGSVDVEGGKAEAKVERELWEPLAQAMFYDAGHLGIFSEAGILVPEADGRYKLYGESSGAYDLAGQTIDAYDYYNRFKNSKYKNNLFGVVAGNYRLGDAGERQAKVGADMYYSKSTDTEAAELYDLTMGAITDGNERTFNNDGSLWKSVVAPIASYIPQGINQAKADLMGRAIAAAFTMSPTAFLPGMNKLGDTLGAAMSAKYMFDNTAGMSYYRQIKNGLSADDAYRLASSEAISSAVVEFGVGYLADKIIGGISKRVVNPSAVIKKLASEGMTKSTAKVISTLAKEGFSKEGIKVVLSAGKSIVKGAGGLVVNNLSEGVEEWIQQGMSITADRYAQEGKSLSAAELFRETFNFSKYTKEDYESMNESFVAGFVIGSFGHITRSTMGRALGEKHNAALTALSSVNEKALGKEVLKLSNSAEIVDESVKYNVLSPDRELSRVALSVRDKVESGETLNPKDVGKLVKGTILSGNNVLYNVGESRDVKTDSGEDVVFSVRNNKKEKPLKNGVGSGKIKSTDGSQYRTMWTVQEGILDNREIASFYSKISEMKNLGYKNYNKTASGEYIFEIGNKLVVTDGDYSAPDIETVFTFVSDSETTNALAREFFYEKTKSGYTIQDAQSFIETIYGEGFISRADKSIDSSYERMRDRGREGNSGRKADSRSGKNVATESSDNDETLFSLGESSQKSGKIKEDGDVEFDSDFDAIFDEAISRVKITKVKMSVFPPYNKSKSDANERATRWAFNEDVQTGAQAIAFYHDQSYIIEKFDSTEFKYIIKGIIDYGDYQNIRKELKVNAQTGNEKSIEKLASVYDKRNRQRDTSKRRGQSIDGNSIKYRDENNNVQRVGEVENSEWEIYGNTDRSDERNGSYRQSGSLEKDIESSENDKTLFSLGESSQKSGKINNNAMDERSIVFDKDLMLYNNKLQLDNVVMQAQIRAHSNKKRLPKMQYSYTSDYFVVWSNKGVGEYDFKFAIEAGENKELISAVRRELENGTYRNAESFNARVNRIRGGQRSNSRDNSRIETPRTNRENGGLSSERSESDTGRNPAGNVRNSDGGQSSDYSIRSNYEREASEEVGNAENYRSLYNRMGYSVISEPNPEVKLPDGAVVDGYVDHKRGEVYIAPDAKNSVYKHELMHIISRMSKRNSQSFLNFCKKNIAEWDELYSKNKEKYDEIKSNNPDFKVDEELLEQETIADLSIELSKDDVIEKYRDSSSDFLGRVRLWYNILKNQAAVYFGKDSSQERKLKIAALKWELALASAKKKGATNGGDGISFMYAGEKSKTADRSMLNLAKEMSINGKAASVIWKETGWRIGADGKWRFEIDDSKAVLKSVPSEAKSLKLSDVLIHDELYKAYPQLRNVEVEFSDDMRRIEGGYYNPGENLIVLNSKNSAEKMKSSMIHEIQHAVQGIEGFLNGGNTQSALMRLRRNAIIKLLAESPYFKKVCKERTPAEVVRYVDNYLKKKYNKENIEDVANKAYLDLYGEREARDTSARQDMNAEQRRDNFSEYDKGALLENEYSEYEIQADTILQKVYPFDMVHKISSLEVGERSSRSGTYNLQQERREVRESSVKENASDEYESPRRRAKSAEEILDEIDIVDELLKDTSIDAEERAELRVKKKKLERSYGDKRRSLSGELKSLDERTAKKNEKKEESVPSFKYEEAVKTYKETGDSSGIPDKKSAKMTQKYYQERADSALLALGDVEGDLAAGRYESEAERLEMETRRDALKTRWREAVSKNEVMKQVLDILDEIDTVARPNHKWVRDASVELSDKQNIIKDGLYKTNDVERNFRNFFGKYFKVAYEKVLKPFFDSKKRYAEGVTEYAKKLREEIVDGLKIKAGSRESAAVMWLGEGRKPISKKAGAELADYTYENSILTNADLDSYLNTGRKQHTRNKKMRMMEAGKSPILTTLTEIRRFISDVVHGNAQGEVRAFGRVGKRLADAISSSRYDLDMYGDYIEINADDIRESYKMHSSPKENGDIPLSEKDFLNIPEYLNDFAGVLGVNTYNGKVEIHIYSQTKEGYIRILTVASKERGSLQVTKLIGVSKEKFEQKYAKKIERDIGSPRGQKDSNPSTTARHTADALSNISISQDSGKGNKKILTEYTYEDCVKEFGEKRASDIKKAAEVFRKMYDELLDKVNETRAKIYPNNPDKLVPRRDDYFHHFQEMGQGFAGLRNILNANIGIDPMLVGVSEYTKPKSKFAGFMQRRLGEQTEYDAVLGFLKYLPAAQYSIHIDPNIVNFRSLAYDLASAKASENNGAGNPNANVFIKYLQTYANSLAGKTVSHADRGWIDNFNRTSLAVISWLNNMTKASAVLGNVNSVLSQVTNVKNMIGKISHQSDALRGALEALAGINPKSAIASRYNESGFLKERFLQDSLDDYSLSKWNFKKVMQTPGHWASWMLGFADEIGTRVTWNAAYNEAIRKNIKDAAQYADNFTRQCVAGRGIGEDALVFKSRMAKLFLPFRTEVLNDLRVQQDILFGKEYDIWEKNGEKITPDMSEKKRYEILKNRVLKVAHSKSLVTENVTEEDVKRLETEYKKEAKPILRKLADEFGVIRDYNNEDIELEFGFSNGSLRESINKQKKNYTEFAKMMSCFDEVVENAVGIEVHKDKYAGTERADTTLKQTYVLASAFSDGKDMYPVKLLVKEFKDKPNKLYVAVVVNKKENTIMEQALQENATSYPQVFSEEDTFSVQTAHHNDDASYTPVPSIISISQLLNSVNDEDFDKYIPKQFKKNQKQSEFDKIVAMGDADSNDISPRKLTRVKNIMQLFVASAVINAVIAAIKSDEFDPVEEAEEGFEENGVFGALESVMKDYADGTGNPVAFDPIYDIATGVYQGIGEGVSVGEKIGKAALRSGQNLLGDAVSNNPFSTVAMSALGVDSEISDFLFNGSVYTPGGAGMPLAGNVARSLAEVVDEDYLSAVVAIAKGFIPMGTQIDRSVKGFYEYKKGYATNEAAYERMKGEDGELKYLIEPGFWSGFRSVLFGSGAYSKESNAFYNDKSRKFSEEEQAEILSHSDYESRKVTFDDILAMNKYESTEEKDKRKEERAKEFFDAHPDGILHNLYLSGEDAAVPYKNVAGEMSYTDSKTDKKYTLKLKAADAERLTKEVSDKIAERFARAESSESFAGMSREEQIKYLNAVADSEYKQAKVKALYDSGQMGYSDYFRLEANYKEATAKRDRALFVDDASVQVEFNAADVVGQYITYSDVSISEEGYDQLEKWYEYSSTRKADSVDVELMRLSNVTGSDINVSGNPYGVISYEKNGVDYKIAMPDNKIYALCDEVDKAVRSALYSLFAKATYKNATSDSQKDMIASVKRKVRDGIKDKYKARYKSVRITEFDKIVAMK